MSRLQIHITIAITSCALVAQADDSKVEFFETKIRPVLVEHCYGCHSAKAKNIRGGLLLDSKVATLDGGESGAAVVPGNPDDSLLLSSLRHESFEMPPDRKLPDHVIADFEKWIRDGAADPREGGTKVERTHIDLEEGRRFWSFQPVVPQTPPHIDNDDWSKSDIDRFIAAKLHEQSLPIAADALPEQIYRRLSFGLIGRPPEPQRILQFIDAWDSNPDAAISSAVEEFLASPLFGQRWGRHWLDVVRFAESSGGGRSLMFPHAWRFRDYVIQSFNDDKPFDQLVREHIAGDLLPADSDEQRNDQLTGVGYLTLGPTNYELQDKALLRMEVVDEQVDTFGRTFLGMTIGCARCHDHKFDPIPTADYYSLSGIFRSTRSLITGNVSSPVTNTLTDPTQKSALQEWASRDSQLKTEIAKLKTLIGDDQLRITHAVASTDLPGIVVDDTLAVFEGEWTKSVSQKPWVDAGYQHNSGQKDGHKVVFEVPVSESGKYRVDVSYSQGSNRCREVVARINHATGSARRSFDQRKHPAVDGLFHDLGIYNFRAGTPAVLSVDTTECGPGVVIIDAVRLLPVSQIPQNIAREESRKLADQLAVLEEQRKKHEQRKPKAPVAMGVVDEAEPGDWHIHLRGGIRNLGPIVPRGGLTVLNHAADDLQSPFKIPEKQSGRLQLANWIASPNNPLTARVFVNRVWLHLIGKGLVSTPDNFGKTGRLPSHPELLDHLASTFVNEDDWSVKNLIRRITTSHVYRLSSSGSTTSDPANQFFGRGIRRRLSAEPLRDSILTVSGQLEDDIHGGLTIGKTSQYDNGYDHDKYRPNLPSVFVPAFRNAPLKFFETFDYANPNLVVGQRSVSTLPSQALYLLNSPFMLKQSAAAAERFTKNWDENSVTLDARIEKAWLTTLGRKPTAPETAAIQNLLSQQHTAEPNAWSAVFQSLFASVDFRYVD